ncbi:MAG: GreA/GreB family elongation factor, partial [bacterium]|nr:GreA/GreB family elongation factor [bacterium]
VLSGAEALEPIPNDGVVRYGRTVTFKNLDTEEVKIVRLGSFYVVNPQPNVASYTSPLARLLIGARVGEIREGEIGTQKCRLQIVQIE